MPFKGYWYIIALGAVASAICVVYQSFYVLFIYYLWLLYLYFFHRCKPSLMITCICLSIFFYLFLPNATAPNNATPLSGNVTVEGNIAGPINWADTRIEFPFRTNQNAKVQVVYFQQEYPIKPDNIRYGATCVLTGKQNIPDQASNPHQFDYQDYLWKQGISSQLIISSLEDIECFHHSYLDYIHTLRHNLMGFTTDKLAPMTVSWLHALVFGDDHLLDQSLVDVFQRWGLSHLLAISGLHIGIVVALFYFILVRLSMLTKEKAQTMLCIFLPTYAVLAGGQPSVWRASLMVVIVILFAKFKWKINYSDLISLVFLLLMMLDKQIIYHIGFQLSFAVTFAIILSRKWLAQSTTNMETLFKISFVSQMAILPLQLHYFSIFQPLSILLNLIIVPYFSFIVIPFMFFMLCLSILPKHLLKLPENIFYLVHQNVMEGLIWIDAHLDAPFVIGELSLAFMVMYYLFFILMMVVLEKENRFHGFLSGALLTFFIMFLALRPYFSPYGTVTMLDIGQGDAFVVEMPYRKGVFIIDAGAAFSFTDMEASEKVYRQVIRPYLYGQGIHSIDAIFISHEDLDHDGSVSFILDDFFVDEIIISPYYEMSSENRTTWEPYVNIVSVDDVIHRKGQPFYIVSPMEKTDSANENSLVLYTDLGGLSWLFTGDIGKETEQQIVKKHPEMTIDVLKVGHHGSNTSTDPLLAERSQNGAALISVGRNNSYGHPTKDVLATLDEAKMMIFRTDVHGAVQYRFKKEDGVFIPFFPEK